MQKLIIDGYNVIYTDDRLRRLACRDLERARHQLVELIEGYVRNRRVRATIVFDGRGGLTESTMVVPGKLQIVFSTRGQTADELIVLTLRHSGNPREFIVVTSDMADIGRTAKGLGCQVVGSKRFLARLSSDLAVPTDAEDAERDHRYGDTEYWLTRFEEEDSADDGTED